MDAITRIKHWLFPVFEIPAEDDRHLRAIQTREQNVKALKNCLQEEDALEAKLNSITSTLYEAAK